MHWDIEALARFFHARGQLQSYFLSKLVDWEAFTGEPNAGHFAIADFLLCSAVDISVTANVDILVERAVEGLGNTTFLSSVDGSSAAIPREHQPLLKIHGCYRRGPEHTLWCKEQLSEPEWRDRLEDSARWLSGRLAQRDVVFVGYWTDWAYLNEVLNLVLRDESPRSVVLVAPDPSDVMEEKARDLWNWAHRPGIAFTHVQASGTDFLDELRRRFSTALLRRIVAVGREAYTATAGHDAPAFPNVADLETQDLYDLRRDWSGVARTAVTRRRDPEPADQSLGCVFLEMLAAGATLDGSLLQLNGRRIRLVQGAGRMLYDLKEQLGEMSPFDAPEVTVCVGAFDDGGAAAHIIRPTRRSTVIRPGVTGEWCTETRARDLLGMS